MQEENYKYWISKRGYPTIWINNKNIYLHVYIWEKNNGIKPKGFEVHHIDENKLNFNIDNLELLTLSEHRRIHAGWIRKNKEWIAKPCTKCKKILTLDNFYYIKTRKIETNFCKLCHNKEMKKINSTPENIIKKKEYYKQYYIKHYAKQK